LYNPETRLLEYGLLSGYRRAQRCQLGVPLSDEAALAQQPEVGDNFPG
jgi:hypothetical protein